MPQETKITDEQILIAEKALLPDGKFFDPERVDFIKDLTTLDLHAVPGSGKTTALLAKLIALEQHLPFYDRSGILIISHTNAAVDEIKNKIGHICPRLFNYPNFIGTIQGFTDAFLTIPYYKTIYRRRPVRIDDEIYIENHFPDYSLKAWLGRRADGNKLLYKYRLREGDNLALELGNTPFIYGKSTATYQKILALKKGLRENGFLCFDDAYILAQEYLVKYPGIIGILRKRFKYVFIDEMQDMDKHQYELLETLFGDAKEVIYQRIGDKNQAIFNDESEMLDIWQERNVKKLIGSQRLHPKVACIVESLALSPIAVVGNRLNPDGTAIEIQPVLLVYTDANKHLVISKYATIIKQLIDEGKINEKTENVFKAIAWTTSKPDDSADKIKLNHYHPGFSKEHTKLKINYACLESYLHYFDSGKNKLASIRKSILNAILRALRIEGVDNPSNNRSFSKKIFIDFIKANHPEFYNEFKLKVYQICALTVANNTVEALKLLVKLIGDILGKFGKSVKLSLSFTTGKHVPVAVVGEDANMDKPANIFLKDGVKIEVTTVHAVKGQTHTCTLYMESFYQTNVSHKGQYESSRIADQLQGIVLPANAHDYIKQSIKMSYVGFSRPTHLLCFAIHKSRYDSHYAGKPNIGRWQIENV